MSEIATLEGPCGDPRCRATCHCEAWMGPGNHRPQCPNVVARNQPEEPEDELASFGGLIFALLCSVAFWLAVVILVTK